MMGLLRDGIHLNKLLMICLLIVRGTCLGSSDMPGLANSSLVTTTETPNIQTKETPSEGTTSGPIIESSESTDVVTENLEVGTSIEPAPYTHKDSEVITGQSSSPKYDAVSEEKPNITSPKVSLTEIPASAKSRSLDTNESDTTSAIVISSRPTTESAEITTESAEITTGYEAEQTTDISEATTAAVDQSTKTPESEHNPIITTGALEITTDLAKVTINPEVTTNIEHTTENMVEESIKLAKVTTNSEITTNIAVDSKNIAEASTNFAEAVTNVAETTTELEEITNVLKTKTDLEEATTNHEKATTDLEEIPIVNWEITTNRAEITTIQAKVITTTNAEVTTTTNAEVTTNLARTATKFLAETTTNLVPEEVTTNLPSEGTTNRVIAHKPDDDIVSNPETNEIPLSVWFILILDGNCTHLARGRQGQRESGLKRQIIENLTRWLDAGEGDVNIPAGVVCTAEGRVHANLTLARGAGVSNLTGRLKSLEDAKGPLFRFHGQEFFVYQILTADGFLNREPELPVDLRHTDVELLVYIAVGSTCSFLFLLAMGLLACKYCSCRERKAFEFGEPPSANVRLEDYTLTRIPRPKLGYVEYCRGIGKRYCPLDEGMVRPSDTSVVPLEDARARDFHDGVLVRPADIRSLGRAYHAGCCGGYVTDADGYCVHSTENLHRVHRADRYVDKGVDNPNFY